MQRILCIWLPAWPIQRLVVANQEHKSTQRPASSQPLVLHARDARRGQLVVACCLRARKLGVREGMPLAEVSALQKNLKLQSERPAHARAFSLQEHEPELDHEALSDLAVWCEKFSPIVGLENCESAANANTDSQGLSSSLLLDVTGLAPIFGSEERLLELVQEAFSERGYRVRTGFGNTVGVAWAIAHYGEHAHCTSDWGSATGTETEPEATTDILAPLPVEALRLPGKTVDVLQQLGVETIGQLLELPRAGLAARLGDPLIERMDQALGVRPEVIVAHRAAPDLEADFEIQYPTTRRNVIERVLQQLSEEVCRLLEKSDHAAVQVEAELRAQTVTRKLLVSLFQPTSNAQHIEQLLLLQLDALQMQQPIKHIRLAAVTTVRIAGQQHVLWDEVGHGFAQRDSELAQLVDRLSSRLGKDCVFGVQAQAGALPEKAYRKKLLTETIKSKRGTRQTSLRHQNTAATLRAPHRPLWLEEPPLPVQLPLRGGPRLRRNHQPPTSFQFQNEVYEVAHHWGPERIETGWWSGKSVRRDYYRVETTVGCRFWLFRQLDDGAWYLHGCFE